MKLNPLFERLRHDNRGVSAVVMALSATALFGFAAVVVDVGYIFHANKVLQTSTDAAALAGAMTLSSTGAPTSAVSAANTYGADSGGNNATAYLTITANPQTVNCSGQTGNTCTATTTNPNGIKVTQTANVPTYFARLLGINTVSISATSYALQSGGQAVATDIMFVLDTTASMNSTDSSCSGNTRLNCAFAGLKTMLNGFTPSVQHVGLMVFPGLTSLANANLEFDCSSSTPSSSAIAKYNASPHYQIVGLSSDYKSGSSLNTSSNLVKAARGGGAGCTAGVTAYGGVGTFYVDAVTAAQTYLDSNARAGANKMIIFLGDGDANGSSTNVPSSELHQQCHEAITASTTAQSDGVTVVTIGYGSPASGCSTDTSPTIGPCATLKAMATVGTGTSSAPQWFYSDSSSGCTGGNSASNLNGIFTAIGSSVTGGGARLIPAS